MTLLAASAVLFAACQREEPIDEKGNEVNFNVATEYENGSSTRTEYGGERYTVGSASYERIDWIVGDVICLASNKAATYAGSHHTDYTVQSVAPDNEKSIAVVSTDVPLFWGSGTNTFYGLYPAPGSDGVDSGVSFTDDGVATLVLPSDQSNITMRYAFMGTATTATEGSSVSLNFRPLVNAYCFKLLGDASTGMKLKSMTLSSTNSYLVAPSYTVTLDASDNSFGDVTYTTSTASKSITATFGGGSGVDLPISGDSFTFTFFALPETQSNLSVVLTFVENGVEKTKTLALTGLTVQAGQKVNITSSNVPVPDTWEYTLGNLQAVTVGYTGGNGSLASSFVSYKSNDGGATKTAVPFTLEYSTDGGTTWTTTPPSWLTLNSGINYGGSASGQALGVTVAQQVNSAPDPHHDALVAKGSYSTAFDLSTRNVATGATVSRTTANCYVVDRPGNYKFPLVYGNGVKNGSVNESAFRAKAGVDATDYRPDNGATNYLGRFKDHLDNNITSPYIATQQSGKAMGAVLVWEDVQGLVTVDPVISGSGENAYITFSVPEATITQGNALIAVLVDDDNDGTPETVAWSWHVWVTEEDLTAVKEGSNSNYFAPVNIGWCEGKTETYAARTCQVRATQAGSGLARTATLAQTAGSVVTGGNSPYYQWGRKDPLQASNGKGNTYPNTFKTYYPSSSAYAPAVANGPVSIGAAIRSPYTFYRKEVSPYDWCSTTYHNHWSSTIAGTGLRQNANAKAKTVYDPSPVGFRVPSPDAWNGFNTSNFTWGTVNGDKGRTYVPSGLFFPASGYRYGGSGGVDDVGSDGFHWSSSPYTASDGYYLRFYSGRVDPSDSNSRVHGFPVRCVKE